MTTYAIVGTADVTGSRWDDIVQSPSTIGKESDIGNKIIIKWREAEPSWFAALGVPTYDNTRALFFAWEAFQNDIDS